MLEMGAIVYVAASLFRHRPYHNALPAGRASWQYGVTHAAEREPFGTLPLYTMPATLPHILILQAVLHVTNLASHVGETELTTFFSQLGSVAFATLLPSAGTALVEMSSIQESEKVIAFGQTQPVSLAVFHYLDSLSR